MKRHEILRVVVFFFAITLVSCQDEARENVLDMADVKYEEALKESLANRPPEIPPMDIGLSDLITNPEATWEDYDRFYKDVVVNSTDKPYFRNLQIQTISVMFERAKEIQSAPLSFLEVYIVQLYSRNFINDANTILRIAEIYSHILPADELEKIVLKLFVKNINFLAHAEVKFRNHHLGRNDSVYLRIQNYIDTDRYKFIIDEYNKLK